MHATLEMAGGGATTAAFHATYPETFEPVVIERSVYGETRGPRWHGLALVVLGHILLIGALIKLDVIPMAKAKHGPLVVDLVIEPPAPPPVPKEQPKPVEKVKSLIVAPPPIVQTVAPAPSPVIVTQTPPPPKAEVASVTPPAPTGPVSVDDVSSNMLYFVKPVFAMESRRRHEEGMVRVVVLIGTDGNIRSATVSGSSGFARVDKSVVDAIRQWRFKPFVRSGQPIEVQGLISFNMKLK